jgi:hypothetical protein
VDRYDYLLDFLLRALKIKVTLKEKIHIKVTCDTTCVHELPGVTAYFVNREQLRAPVPYSFIIASAPEGLGRHDVQLQCCINLNGFNTNTMKCRGKFGEHSAHGTIFNSVIPA